MVVVAFLHRADLRLEAHDLNPVLTQHTGRWRHRAGRRVVRGDTICRRNMPMVAVVEGQHLFAVRADAAVRDRRPGDLFEHAFRKGLEHLGMIAEIAGLDAPLCGPLRLREELNKFQRCGPFFIGALFEDVEVAAAGWRAAAFLSR